MLKDLIFSSRRPASTQERNEKRRRPVLAINTRGGDKNVEKKLPPRHKQIVSLVEEKGFVSIERLSQHFDVTPQTIRRDINKLSEEGHLRRYHGGAGPNTSVSNYTYSVRRTLRSEEKSRVARLVAKHIPNNASLFLDIGTSTEEVAKALMSKTGLRIITNNLNVVSILSTNESFEIYVTGGLIRNHDLGILGDATVDFIKQFKVDFGIVSVAGIDPDGTLIDFDYNEVRVTRAIMTNSRRVFLVADHSKFGRGAMARIGHISEVSALFTDSVPSPDFMSVIEDAGINLYISGTGQEPEGI
jgi:DeoR family glycerol-3-phosphate regulon repressor